MKVVRDYFQRHPRPAGVILLILAAAMIYGFVYEPARQAQRGAEQITLSLRGVMLGPALGIPALLMLVQGSGFGAWFPQPPARLAKRHWAAVVAISSSGLPLYGMLKLYLRHLGCGS